MCHKCSFSYEEHIVLRETGLRFRVLKMAYTAYGSAGSGLCHALRQPSGCMSWGGGEGGIFWDKKFKYTIHLCRSYCVFNYEKKELILK
jgi:hypothetical protein